MDSPILEVKNLSVAYDQNAVLKKINLQFSARSVTAIMGPSGCGKTTLIRALNRLHELSGNATTTGEVRLRGQNLYALSPIEVRRRIGMVFQRPNPFPTMTIYENVLAGHLLNGITMARSEMDALVEDSLRKAALWNEVKDDLKKRGTFLSGGQQQRLCIARTLAMKPEIILLDEPTSALDPIATASIEELIENLKRQETIIMVTHNMAQAARISDFTAFLFLGELIEYGTTEKMFTVPSDPRTQDYLRGSFG